MNTSRRYGIFVINLARAVARRQWMERHLHARGLDGWTIVDGVEGAAIPDAEIPRVYDDRRARHRAGRTFTRGEIGCSLSHRKACLMLLDSGLPWGLVLEDDAWLAEDAPALLGALDAWLVSDEPRVLLLSPLTGFLLRDARPLQGRYRMVRVHRAWNAHGYALNRAAARALASENDPVYLMADDWVGYRRGCGVEVRGVDPFCIGTHELAAQSQLEAERARQRKKERTLGFRLRSLRERLARHLVELLWLRPAYGIGRHGGGQQPGDGPGDAQ